MKKMMAHLAGLEAATGVEGAAVVHCSAAAGARLSRSRVQTPQLIALLSPLDASGEVVVEAARREHD